MLWAVVYDNYDLDLLWVASSPEKAIEWTMRNFATRTSRANLSVVELTPDKPPGEFVDFEIFRHKHGLDK